jgi:predicted ATP-grasp superfamily ATP-dependent carboligase
VELAKNGFEFQASVGVEPVEHGRVKPGEKVQVNNRTLSAPEGGFTLVRKGKLREVSIVSMGCDDRTAVAIAASKMKENWNVKGPWGQANCAFFLPEAWKNGWSNASSV